MLILHLLCALGSLAFTAFTFFTPSSLKIKVSQALIVMTLLSGTVLIITTHADMLHACAMGLVYVAVVSFGIAAAAKKVSAANNED